MKSNFFKYIFVIFAIAITIFAVVKIKNDENSNSVQIIEKEEEEEPIVTELKLGVASFDSINPILSKNKNIQDVSKLIFESLVTMSVDYKAEACLAKEWAKQNDTTYLIKLRDDVKWSDGEKFTADDVKFTVDRLKDSDTIYSSNVEHVTNLEVVDETTVKILLDSEVPFFEYNLTFPILSSKYYEEREFNADIVPVGTGMYKVIQVEEASLLLEKNEYYWGNDSSLTLDKISINLYSSTGELYNAFKMGNIDLVSTQNSSIQDYIGTIGYASKEMKGREHTFIAFNTQGNILSDVNVRRAICYSIDKSNIVSSIYSDKYVTSNFPLDYGSWVCKNQDLNTEYDLDQAKQVLVDNGWSYKYKYWQKIVNYRTQRISLNMVVKSTDENMVKVAENIKAQLENQGIRITLISATNEQYNNYLQTKNYDMLLCSINLSINPNMTTFFGDNNLANYSNEEVTNIIQELKNTTDEDKIREDYKRLGEIYTEEVPYLSLYNNKYIVAYSSGLAGTVEPNWFYQFYNIEDWHK